MSGISGVISKNAIKESTLNCSIQTLTHRGPKDYGVFKAPNQKVGLTHREKPFLELSVSEKQPLSLTDKGLTISLNGVVYNAEEIRKNLIDLGFEFQSKTDAEVILQGYACWGVDILQHLKGMYAFAIYDAKEEVVFLGRDRFGIKPLYYAQFNENFVFGSEIKALFSFSEVKKNIRKESVAAFLANRYVPSPYTIWEDIYQLPPAHYLLLDVNTLEIKTEKYWDLGITEWEGNEIEEIEKIKKLLQNSVEQHLKGNVEVGSFLSGGMDSSLLVLMMKELGQDPIHAFTIGFENWENSEHFYARKVAEQLGINLSEQLEDSFTLDAVRHLMYFYDNPIADISILPTHAVSKLASSKVNIVLSGEGADECFGGYWWHQPQSFKFKNRFQKWKSKFMGVNFQQIKNHYIEANSMGLFDVDELKQAFTEEWQSAVPDDPFEHMDKYYRPGISILKQIQYLDLNLFMPELILPKVERASQAHALETRAPFLDHELVEKIFSLKEALYFNKNTQKKILRSFLKNKVPAEVYDRKKQGFVGPDKFYENIPVYKEKLIQGRLVTEGVIRLSYIEKLIASRDHWRLWKLFVLENWWEVWN